jgi:ferrous iron transport protein B
LSENELAEMQSAVSDDHTLTNALRKKLDIIDRREAAASLEASIAGRIGIALEHITKDLTGFDWRTNIALLGGFAAKEVVISTLGTAYSLGDSATDNAQSLSTTLAQNPDWNSIKALSVIIFVIFYAPCFVTVTCIAKESGSWKWGIFSILFNTTIAFILSAIVFNIGNMMK